MPRPDIRAPETLFVRQRPDHVPPESLDHAELAASIASLELKLLSSKRSLMVAQTAGVLLVTFVVVLGGLLLYFGPSPFLQHVFHNSESLVATTYDVVLWWLALVVLAVFGGIFGDQLLRGRLRLSRGWKHRVAELSRRLDDAQRERLRREAGR